MVAENRKAVKNKTLLKYNLFTPLQFISYLNLQRKPEVRSQKLEIGNQKLHLFFHTSTSYIPPPAS